MSDTGNTASGAAVAERSAPRQAAVRMYRQGLGDCFLITLPTPDGAWHMMIDCGVILGTAKTEHRLREVIEDVIRDTRGRIDVLVVTHEHYDHNAAFADKDLFELFCADDAAAPAGKLRVGEVWLGWSENLADPLGRKLSKARADQVDQLAGMVARLNSLAGVSDATGRMADSVAELLSFFGVDPAAPAQAAGEPAGAGMGMAAAAAKAPRVGATARGMDNVRRLGGADGKRMRYWTPGDPPWTDAARLPGVRIYVLGPPRDEAMLKKTFAKNEVYHLASSDAANAAFFGAAGFDQAGEAGAAQDWSPFDPAFSRPLGDPTQQAEPSMPASSADFLLRRYYGPSDDPVDHDQSWRRIDEDWLGSAVQFALKLDAATNNTSLVLAIELSPGGDVLLFPADAQVGNWLSWQGVSWTIENRTVTATDLLKRTVFYKVGHHGSHNATLRENGLELMPFGLTAMIPVDHAMAVKKKWNGMPLKGLIDALTERECTVIRMDEDLPRDKRLRPSDSEGQAIKGPLHYEWRVAIE